MTTDPWPPEGTRVRIVGTLEDGSTGRIDSDGMDRPEHIRWVKLDMYTAHWPVYRHEIEVIDGEH